MNSFKYSQLILHFRPLNYSCIFSKSQIFCFFVVVVVDFHQTVIPLLTQNSLTKDMHPKLIKKKLSIENPQ